MIARELLQYYARSTGSSRTLQRPVTLQRVVRAERTIAELKEKSPEGIPRKALPTGFTRALPCFGLVLVPLDAR